MIRLRVWAAMVEAVRGNSPQKVWAPGRTSSIWSVISPKVVSIRLRHSAITFTRPGGMVLRWALVGGNTIEMHWAARDAANFFVEPLVGQQSGQTVRAVDQAGHQVPFVDCRRYDRPGPHHAGAQIGAGREAEPVEPLP